MIIHISQSCTSIVYVVSTVYVQPMHREEPLFVQANNKNDEKLRPMEQRQTSQRWVEGMDRACKLKRRWRSWSLPQRKTEKEGKKERKELLEHGEGNWAYLQERFVHDVFAERKRKWETKCIILTLLPQLRVWLGFWIPLLWLDSKLWFGNA